MSRSPQPRSQTLEWKRQPLEAPLSTRSWLRQLATIGLVHAVVLLATYFLFVLGDALFTSYVLLLRDSVFVNYITQGSWLKTMAAEIKGATAFVVGISALSQMLLLSWRVALR